MLVAALATVLLVAGGCGDDSKPDDRPTTSSGSPTESSPPDSRVIRYGDDGARIRSADDVSKLEGAPEAFKTFIAGLLKQARADDDGACDVPPTYTVDAVDTSGFASGAFIQCGGYVIIWATVGGSWREVWGGQENPGCEEMTRLGVPAAIAGDTCFDGEGEVPYKP